MSDSAVAVVAGAGPGLGAALCRRLAAEGYAVAALARRRTAVDTLVAGLRAQGGRAGGWVCDLSDAVAVDAACTAIEREWGAPSVYIHNAGAFLMKPFLAVAPDEFGDVWRTTCLAAMLGAQRLLPGMVARGAGCLLFTGATAAVRGGANFAAFASAKFALRGLAQSLAREFGPRGIHVAHVVIDGRIAPPGGTGGEPRENFLEPDAIAESFLQLIRQHRSAWTQELDLRPDRERY